MLGVDDDSLFQRFPAVSRPHNLTWLPYEVPPVPPVLHDRAALIASGDVVTWNRNFSEPSSDASMFKFLGS